MLVMYNPISLKGDKGTLLTRRVASQIAIFLFLLSLKKLGRIFTWDRKYFYRVREYIPLRHCWKSYVGRR